MFSANDVKTLREKTGAGMLDCKKALDASNGDISLAIDWLKEKGIAKAAKKSERIAAEGLCSILVDGNKAVILEVNSETDFVAKNEEFKTFVAKLANVLIQSDVKTMEEANKLNMDDETVADKIVAITSKIGEKISFRRFELLTKNDDEVFGEYIHMGGKIGVVSILSNTSFEVAKDVAMHACAMKPSYVSASDVKEEELAKERAIYKEQAMNEGKPENIAEKMVEGRIKKYLKEICLEEQPFIKDGDISVKTYVSNNGGTIVNMVRYEVGEGIEKRQDNFAEEVMNQING